MSYLKSKLNTFTKTPDNRGNWEFNFFQKKFIPNEEQAIKAEMRPENSFDPKKIRDYITPQKTKEDIIIEKKDSGKILTKAETIIYDNYMSKKDLAIKEDIEQIEKFGLNAKPTTNEGRTRLLLITLQNQLSKGNSDNICNIFLRLMEDQFVLTDEIKKDNEKILKKMEDVVQQRDLIELQFTKLHDQMPPLNTKGFKKLDSWQIEVVNNIDIKKSTVVIVPTSGGKTAVAAYAITKGRVLFVLPTDALAWQVSSYAGGIVDGDLPIITETYHSLPKRELMIERLNSAQGVVGTAETIVTFLPHIKTNFDWIIFDEIHMIGKPDGKDMELIAKIFNNVPFLALSATIGNVDHLTQWFQSLNPQRNVGSIVCSDRFFNLQRFYYNSLTNKLDMLNPLSLVTIDDFKSGNILKKNLQPTPYDTWNLYIKMKETYDLNELDHKKYFEKHERVELSKANQFFNDLIKFIVDNFDEEKINYILTSFTNTNLSDQEVDLVKLAFLLKAEDKAPVIVFQKNTTACQRLVRQFAKITDDLEDKQFPRLRSQRMKDQKKARRIDKQKERTSNAQNKNAKGIDSKKEQKKFLEEETIQDDFIPTSIQEPTEEFNFNPDQYFTDGIVEEWFYMLKKYFPSTGDEYHYIIKLLWRGVGIYSKGLPDPYLRLVQKLASKKQLAIVFSDMSLVFGVSMPFRTVVIYRDSIVQDDLDAMLYHQMAGRAGRRGLDKKGNVIFAGYKWDRIKELSICPIPCVNGANTLNFVVPHATRICKQLDNNQNWDNIFRNSLNGDSDEDNLELLQSIKSNYANGWNFAISDDINHLHMMWSLRDSEDAIIVSFILTYFRKAFDGLDPTVETNQVQAALFLSHFINKYTTENEDHVLIKCSLFEQPSFSKIHKYLEDLELQSPSNIDGRVYESIRTNKLVRCRTEADADNLRNRLFEFGRKLKAIQHFYYHNKFLNLSRLLAKLLTRIWWIFHTSSPIMKPFSHFDEKEYDDVDNVSDEENMYESNSDNEDSEYTSENEINENSVIQELNV